MNHSEPAADDRADYVPVLFRDDLLALAAGCLIAIGATFVLIAWFSTVSKALAIAGFALLLAAIWIVGRPVGVVIDRSRGVVTLNGVISSRNADLADITGVAITPSHPPLALMGFPVEVGERYDVVLVAGGRTWAVVRRDLEELSARREAERIRLTLVRIPHPQSEIG